MAEKKTTTAKKTVAKAEVKEEPKAEVVTSAEAEVKKVTPAKTAAPKAKAKTAAPAAPKQSVSEKKAATIAKFKQSENDTGSAQVQIALLTQRINHLTEHLKVNKHDNHSRRGLLQMVGKRRSFMKYLEKKDITAYRALIKELGIRG